MILNIFRQMKDDITKMKPEKKIIIKNQETRKRC